MPEIPTTKTLPHQVPSFVDLLKKIRDSNPLPHDIGTNSHERDSLLQQAESYLQEVSTEFGSASPESDAVRREINHVRQVK